MRRARSAGRGSSGVRVCVRLFRARPYFPSMKLFAILSLGLSASLLGCASDPSSADADSDDTAQVDEPAVAAASLAAERGISVGEAPVRQAWQDKHDALAAAYEDEKKLA